MYASLRPKPLELVFLLPAGTNRYFPLLGNYIVFAEDLLVSFNVKCRCHYIESFNPAALAE